MSQSAGTQCFEMEPCVLDTLYSVKIWVVGQANQITSKYPLKNKVFSLMKLFQKNITAHDAPKNMHPRYSLRAPLFAPITLVEKCGLVLYISWLEESSFTVLEE